MPRYWPNRSRSGRRAHDRPPGRRATDSRTALQADLRLETDQLERYRQRFGQANELNLADVAEALRPLLEQTQEHVRDLQMAARGLKPAGRPEVWLCSPRVGIACGVARGEWSEPCRCLESYRPGSRQTDRRAGISAGERTRPACSSPGPLSAPCCVMGPRDPENVVPLLTTEIVSNAVRHAVGQSASNWLCSVMESRVEARDDVPMPRLSGGRIPAGSGAMGSPSSTRWPGVGASNATRTPRSCGSRRSFRPGCISPPVRRSSTPAVQSDGALALPRPPAQKPRAGRPAQSRSSV